MIRAAIAGLGWWGKTLVEAVQGQSKEISFVAGATRTVTPEVQTFAKAQGFDLRASYDELLKDPAIDAVVLTTPNSMHLAQIVAASGAGKHVFCEKPFVMTKADADTAVAAMRKADTPNTAKLKAAWPDVWAELDARYNAPGGVLPEDGGHEWAPVPR